MSEKKKGLEKKGSKKANGWALLPIVVFLILYVGSGIYFQYILRQNQGFYVMPVVVAFVIALMVAMLQNHKVCFDEKLSLMAKGVGDENIVVMLLIFLFAGAFSGLASAAGGSSSMAYLLLSVVPTEHITVGFFFIACIISMAMGTSCGTITVLVPIAIETANAASLNLPIMMGAIVSGAMFGDNMSFISDTTIAATKTQGCEMRDKFRENFFIALPAAIVAVILFAVLGSGAGAVVLQDYDLLQTVPYFVVLILALLGFNVIFVLGMGIILFVIAGLITQTGFGYIEIFAAMGTGTSGMFETMVVAILVAAMGALIENNGGFQYILDKIRKNFKGKSGGQLGIALLCSLVDISTANNTVAIVMAAPIAKAVSKEYGITPKKTASLMDIFSCVWQGIIPYGAQMLIAVGLVQSAGIAISAADIIPNMYYSFLLLISALIAIFLPGWHKGEKK